MSLSSFLFLFFSSFFSPFFFSFLHLRFNMSRRGFSFFPRFFPFFPYFSFFFSHSFTCVCQHVSCGGGFHFCSRFFLSFFSRFFLSFFCVCPGGWVPGSPLTPAPTGFHAHPSPRLRAGGNWVCQGAVSDYFHEKHSWDGEKKSRKEPRGGMVCRLEGTEGKALG